jgi:asparagine synthase (glutamine-hydrolysing)
MCGIFGVIGKQDREAVKAANGTLAHRGPDADGFWFDDAHLVALAHRRLSILDLSAAGAQPMHSDSGRYVISYNGELYNFLDLKKQLQKTNWHGHSDTEVLLACFEEWGLAETVKRIEGMYAIALWDREAQSLTLVRDRLGEKPLYFGFVNKSLVFSSELKPVMSLFKNELTMDPLALQDFFHRSCISGEFSIFKEIRKLRAGHWVTFSLRDRESRTMPEPQAYWRLADIPTLTTPTSVTEVTSDLEAKLRAAIAQQMVADVPLGAFLSGGVDSSLVVALMQSLNTHKVKTFSIGFENRHYDEAPHARAVAKHLGTDHEELYVSEADLLREVPKLASVYDEPFADSSQIPTVLVSKLARKYVTVALSGDGGDELFAGYNRHQFAETKWARVSSVPAPLRAAIGGGIAALSPKTWETLFKIASPNLAQPHEKMYKLAEVLKSGSMSDFYRSVSSHWNDSSPLLNKDLVFSTTDWQVDSAREMTLADAKWYMTDDVLAKVDRAAMSQSLETRAPFLNRAVVETAFGLPMDLKFRDGQSKWILRQILYRYVPQALIERPKMGFGVPLDAWLRHELKDWAWSLLGPEALRQQNVLDAKTILRKWEEHQSGRRNWFTELWDVLMFLSWRKHYGI